MNYEKKYKEIVGQIKKTYLYAQTDSTKAVLEEIFPELAESEDEKVRKEIVRFIQMEVEDEYVGNKWLAWLEKQGQVKESTNPQHENRTCEENGKSLTYEEERIRKEIINYFQCQSGEEPTRKEIHDKWIAWLENIPYTIDHEKREGFHLGYKACHEKYGEQKSTDSYCQENCKGFQETGKCFADGGCKAKRKADSTNEVEPKFKVGDKIYLKPEYRMPDDDTPIANTVKEIRKIDDKHYRFDGSYIFIEDQDKYELVEQKPEENKGNIGGISNNPEWGEDDEAFLDDILCKLEHDLILNKNEKDWLKSLRPQNKWKPSDEQIKVCKEVYADILSAKGFCIGTVNSELNRLEEELKKKGE